MTDDSLRVLTEALQEAVRLLDQIELPGDHFPFSIDLFKPGPQFEAWRANVLANREKRAALAGTLVEARSPEPPPNLSSQMIDGLTFKLKRGEPWTESERGELLDAYQSLMEAYHDVGSLSQGAPESELRAAAEALLDECESEMGNPFAYPPSDGAIERLGKALGRSMKCL